MAKVYLLRSTPDHTLASSASLPPRWGRVGVGGRSSDWLCRGNFPLLFLYTRPPSGTQRLPPPGEEIASAAVAFLVTRSFGALLVCATGVCLTAMVAGVWTSFYLDSAPAATIILYLTGFFLLAFAAQTLRRAALQSRRS